MRKITNKTDRTRVVPILGTFSPKESIVISDGIWANFEKTHYKKQFDHLVQHGHFEVGNCY